MYPSFHCFHIFRIALETFLCREFAFIKALTHCGFLSVGNLALLCLCKLIIDKFTVGQRMWRTAVSHLPTWRPPKQANKARPGLVFYNHYTLTQLYTQIDMGKGNSVPENCDLQSLNFVTRALCIFGGRWRTRRCEVEDPVMFGFWRWRTAISDARLDRFIKIYFVCGRVFDWS